ncbi:MAG: hypothetical protein LC753_17695 [Acidobacteria bacterium]|nr:hypothetical protein [Acidobacteriota bacterium]
MKHNRRDFVRTLGAGALGLSAARLGHALPSDLEQPPVRDPRYRDWSNIALQEAKRKGCTYCDIRFTRNRSSSVTVRNDQVGGGGGGFGGGGGRFGGGDGGLTETYGFGIRVIHSGVWGFSSSPIVTAEEIRRIAGIATDVARASERHRHRRRPGEDALAVDWQRLEGLRIHRRRRHAGPGGARSRGGRRTFHGQTGW